jgi:hypothetical protein
MAEALFPGFTLPFAAPNGPFARWQDNRTQLRVDAQFPGVSRLSIETVIARVEEPLISVDLDEHGYIELLFVENWRYEWCTRCDEKRANGLSGDVVQ